MINDYCALNVKEQAVCVRNTMCMNFAGALLEQQQEHSSLRMCRYCDDTGSQIASSYCRGFSQQTRKSMLTLVNCLPFGNVL